MNTKERLYAVIGGCVGAAVAMVSCSFFPLGAQSQGDRFGEITCTGLKIVAQDGKTGVALGTGAEGSFVAVHGTDGKSRRRCVRLRGAIGLGEWRLRVIGFLSRATSKHGAPLERVRERCTRSIDMGDFYRTPYSVA